MGLLLDLLQKLQLVYNAAANVLTVISPQAYIYLVLPQQHWLPIEYRICFKVMVIMFKALCGQGPEYLWGCVSPYVFFRTLWSIDQYLLVIPSPKGI